MLRSRLALAALAAFSLACGRIDTPFVTANARAHVNMLAGTIGSRPAGSDANRRAREYLIDQLQLAGFEVRVQETDARRPDLGLAGRVANIVAIKQGASPDAIAVVSHYDSVPDGPGAGDDALGAAVSVEAARVLAASPMRHSLMILITDSEESGLLGAAGAMSDATIRDRIAAYLNIEAVGGSGEPYLFETGPGNGWLTAAWARHAPVPRGGSFAVEIYRRTPNDTDFSILKRAGIPGLNFAITGSGATYHTDRDTAENLSERSLEAAGANAVAIVAGLDQLDLRQRTDRDAVYFDIGGTRALAYGPVTAAVVGIVAAALGLLAWIRTAAAGIRRNNLLRFLFLFLWTVAGAAAAVAAMVGALWLLRFTREAFHPWYAQMGRVTLFMISAGVLGAWLVSRAGRVLPARLRGERDPATVWAVTLPFWILAAVATMWFAPSAGYLTAIPLLAAGMVLAGAPLHNGTAVRILSIVVLAVSASIWLRTAADLLDYANSLFGRLPVVTPILVFPVVLAVAALYIAPPLVAIATSGATPLRRPWLLSAVVMAAVAITGLLAYFGNAYSDRFPLRRYARYVQDDGTHTAAWEIGSIEPGLDVDVNAGLQWSEGGDNIRALPTARLAHRFRFTAPATPVTTPAHVSASMQDLEGGIEFSVAVRPEDPSASVTLMLPSGIRPIRSNLPGIVITGNRWRSTFVAPSPDGVVWRVVLPADARARIGESGVVVMTGRAPGPPDGPRLAAWMPNTATAWQVRSLFVVPVGPLLPAPVPGGIIE